MMDPEVVIKGFSSPAFIQEGLPVIAVLMVVLTATGFSGRVGFGVISSNDIGFGVLGKNVCSISLVSSTSSFSSVKPVFASSKRSSSCESIFFLSFLFMVFKYAVYPRGTFDSSRAWVAQL